MCKAITMGVVVGPSVFRSCVSACGPPVEATIATRSAGERKSGAAGSVERGAVGAAE
jgi:hypothetical protein